MNKVALLLKLLILIGCLHANADANRRLAVKTQDGLTLAVQEWGNPNGREVLFIHGLAQSHISWNKQYESALAKEFRIITYDLRGHGDSSKPTDSAIYSDGQKWGNDLEAVIKAANLQKPLLVAWSLGGLVVENYLRVHGGDKNISGIIFVDALIDRQSGFFTPTLVDIKKAFASEDSEIRNNGLLTLLHSCFAVQPEPKDIEPMLVYTGMVPMEMYRTNVPMDPEVLKAVNVPVLIVQGRQDKLVTMAMASFAKGLIGNAQMKVYQNSGHAPFYDESENFNRDLTGFANNLMK